MACHHLENLPEKLKILSSYLTSGGLLIFTDIDKGQEYADKFHNDNVKEEVTYPAGFTSQELEEWLTKAGFTNFKFARIVHFKKMCQDEIEREFILMTTSAVKI